MAVTPLRTSIPADFHPDSVRGDDPDANLTRTALSSLYTTNVKLIDVETNVKAKERLAPVATQMAEEALAQIDKTNEILASRAQSVENEIKAALSETVDPVLAGQIREHLIANKKTAFTTAMQIVQSDKRVAHTILNTPSFLLGLSDENLMLLRSLAEEAFAPDLVQRRKNIGLHKAQLERAGQRFSAVMQKKIKEWGGNDDKALEALK